MLVSMVLAFMAAVTCYLLAMVFALATDGAAREIEVLVYGIASAFGLEFLWTAWPRRWGSFGEPTER